MKFIENFSNVGRTGIISEFPKPWDSLCLKTPLYLTHTRGGTIPHLTYNTLKYLKKAPMFLLQTLPTVVDFKDAVAAQDKALGTYIGIPELPIFLTIQDPGTVTPSGYNVKKSVSVWSHGGRKLITSQEYMNIVKSFKPACYQALCDSDTPALSAVKRLNKSVDHSLRFLDDCIVEHKKCPELEGTAIFGTIEGGYDLFLRQKSANLTVLRPVDGFVIDGFHSNGPEVQDLDFCAVQPVLLETLALLPVDKPRILNGAFNPEFVLEAIKCGIDVFDSSYAHVLSESGEACVFPLTEIPFYFQHDLAKRKKCLSKICLKENEFKNDLSPVLNGCVCYTCIHYSKAYLNHLLTTSELLAQILLMIHNLHHMSEFFSTVQKVIENT